MLPAKLIEKLHGNNIDKYLQTRLHEWAVSKSFVEFLNRNEAKVIKKLNGSKKIEDQRDIGIELYVAFIFSDLASEVIYEPSVDESVCPDFKIILNDSEEFFCEVKRIRINPMGEISDEDMFKKCGDVICEKIKQSISNRINILYIRTNGLAPDLSDFESAVAINGVRS